MLDDLGPLDLFPYEKFRRDQKDFINNCRNYLEEGQHVVISAPNGFGKTISVLCATIPVAIKKDLKIVYLCRTHTQNKRVIDELNSIYRYLLKKGIISKKDNVISELGGIALKNRKDMCFKRQINEVNNLSPSDASTVCSQIRQSGRCIYYKNLKKLMENHSSFTLPDGVIAIDPDFLKNFCMKKKICPYFFSKELQEKFRISVANYNWVFNPFILEQFLKYLDCSIEDLILIIDEAHNLPPLGERLYSYKLTESTIKYAINELKDYYYSNDISDVLEFLNELLLEFKNFEIRLNKSDEIEIDERALSDKLNSKLDGQLKDIIKDLEEFGEEILKDKIKSGKSRPRSHVAAVAKFWREWIYTTIDKPYYYHCFSTNNDSSYSTRQYLEAFCLDPGVGGFKGITENVYSTISISGTIDPKIYSILCSIPDPKIIKYDTPFEKNQVKALILKGVTSLYKTRNANMYKKYLHKITEMAMATPKNSAAFCASYAILEGIKRAGFEDMMRKIGKVPLLENRNMSSDENENLISRYKEYSKKNGAVLLGVCGGRNSEGQDFPGDEMNAVMICGIPYPMKTERIKKKIDYYNYAFNATEDLDGNLIAYTIPTIQKSNQACGRPIRKLRDRAVIILADERFKNKYILRFISSWIVKNLFVLEDVEGALKNSIERFFKATPF
ncbi:MAG: helicase C-terminal domain-containing protein [Promethearchaeota archaeon]